MKKFLAVVLIALICLSTVVTCFAAKDDIDPYVYENPTPSVQRPVTPEVVIGEVDIDGVKTEYIAIIYIDGDLNKPVYVPVDDVIITPYILRNSALVEIKNALDSAYYELSHAKKLSDFCEVLDAMAAERRKGANSSNLVVYELFDIRVSEDYRTKYMANEASFIRFTFKVNSEFDESNPIVIHRLVSNNEWVAVPAAQVVDNENGTFSVDFNDLCPIAFLTLSDDAAIADPGTLDTPTGSSSLDAPANSFNWGVVALGSVAVLGVAIAAVVLLKKKKNDDADTSAAE